MNGSRQKARYEENRTERGSDDSRAHGVARKRVPLAQFPGLENDQAESAGNKRYSAAGVEQDVVSFMARPIRVVEGFSCRADRIPPDPEQYDNPEQTSFHSTMVILQRKTERQLGGGGGLTTARRVFCGNGGRTQQMLLFTQALRIGHKPVKAHGATGPSPQGGRSSDRCEKP